MEPTDLTTRILIEIRDAVRATNERVDHLTVRVDHLTVRVDHVGERIETVNVDLGRRIVESELRTATAITDLHGTMRDIRSYLKDRDDLRGRVETCEREIEDLKRQVG